MRVGEKRMRELIAQAKDAAKIQDFTPCGMGLAPRIGFSTVVYKATLEALIANEQGPR